MKICTKCHKELPLAEFHRDSSKIDGLFSSCKDCRRAERGAVKRRVPGWYPDAAGYIAKANVRQHRYVMERKIGRKLRKSEEVHHLDNDKTNNKPENLVLCSSHAEHMRLYHPIRVKNGAYLICTGCGKPRYHPLSKLLRSSKKNYRCHDCWRDPKYGRLVLQTPRQP